MRSSTIKRLGGLVPASLLNLERQHYSNLSVVLKTVLADYYDIRGRSEFVHPLLPPNFYGMTIGFNNLSTIMAITYHKIFCHGFLLSNAFKVRPISYLPIYNYLMRLNLVVSTHISRLLACVKRVKKICQLTFSSLFSENLNRENISHKIGLSSFDFRLFNTKNFNV